MLLLRLTSILLLSGACSLSAIAAASGQFIATDSCQLMQSFRKGTPAGSVRSTPGQRYPVVEISQQQDWVRLRVPGLNHPAWLAVRCGRLEAAAPAPSTAANSCSLPDQQDHYLLAASWQPGFCEHSRSGASKPECQAMARGELRVNYLTLHGLWPNKNSCGTDYGHCPGPALQLQPETLRTLRPWMPSLQYGLGLARHEWDKHGTCQTRMNDDDYFRTAAEAVRLLNESPIGQLLQQRAGGFIHQDDFWRAVDLYFGNKQARHNFSLICNGPQLQEIRVHLPRGFRLGTQFKDLLGGQYTGPGPQPGNRCRSERIRIEASGS